MISIFFFLALAETVSAKCVDVTVVNEPQFLITNEARWVRSALLASVDGYPDFDRVLDEWWFFVEAPRVPRTLGLGFLHQHCGTKVTTYAVSIEVTDVTHEFLPYFGAGAELILSATDKKLVPRVLLHDSSGILGERHFLPFFGQVSTERIGDLFEITAGSWLEVVSPVAQPVVAILEAGGLFTKAEKLTMGSKEVVEASLVTNVTSEYMLLPGFWGFSLLAPGQAFRTEGPRVNLTREALLSTIRTMDGGEGTPIWK